MLHWSSIFIIGEIKMISVEFLKSMESLSLYPEKSNEAISDQMDQSSPGGDLASDATAGESENSNEQNNDLSLGSSDDLGGSMGDSGGLDDGSSSDFGGGGDSAGDMGGEEKQLKLEPEENPFKVQNAKLVLSDMIIQLQNSIEDTLSKIHSSGDVNGVFVKRLEDLLDNVDKLKETVYVQPKESTMVKYRLCVKTYSAICKELCDELKK